MYVYERKNYVNHENIEKHVRLIDFSILISIDNLIR